MVNDFQKMSSSPLGVADEIDQISRDKFGSHHDIHNEIKDLTDKIEKMVRVNVLLQNNLSKLGLEVAQLVEELKLGVLGQKQARDEERNSPLNLQPLPPAPFNINEVEEQVERSEGLSPSKMDDLLISLKELTQQNSEVAGMLRRTNTNIEKNQRGKKLNDALREMVGDA